ncbi:tail fiber domain-containing protein [Microvirga massiliensis]|uniref:tail fiber domain-containing protein n=1 Tax=Microvirga massiliensis TaxID=1033741 RepID=UPI00065FC223|nr:tail fiber domain-containing protein [Microvirga massiliensis]
MPIENSVSVTAGSRTVTGFHTQFVALEGDTFNLNGVSVPIDKVVSSAELMLAYGWPAETATDQTAFVLMKTSPYWSSNVTTNALVQELIKRIREGLPFKPDAFGSLADRAAFDNQKRGFTFLQIDTNPFLISAKLSDATGHWSAGQSLKGESAAPVEFRVDPETYSIQYREVGETIWTAVVEGDLDNILGPYRSDALASALAAAASEAAARTSETNSATSAGASANSAAASLASQNAAKASETASQTSETNSATSASQSASSAEASANSAAASLASEQAAATSESNAAASAATSTAQAGISTTRAGEAAASAGAAEFARTGAETARSGAEAAQAASEAARDTGIEARDVTTAARDVTLEARDATFAARDEAEADRAEVATAAAAVEANRATVAADLATVQELRDATGTDRAAVGADLVTVTTLRGEVEADRLAVADDRAAVEAALTGTEAARDVTTAARDETVAARDATFLARDEAEAYRLTVNTTAAGVEADRAEVATNLATVQGLRDETATDRAAVATDLATVTGLRDEVEADRVAVAADRTASETARTGAETARSGAEAAREAAETAEANAEAAQAASETARNLAQDWANAPEDVAVAPNGYSARHWAEKARDFSTGDATNIVVTPTGNLQSVNVQAALEELDAEVATKANVTDVEAAIGAISTAWPDIAEKPETFPPAPHRHPASEIDGLEDAITTKVDKAGDTMEGKLTTVAPTAEGAGFNLPSGTAPTSPVSGDFWFASNALFFRMGSTTRQVATVERAQTWTARQTFATPSTSTASINLPHGTAPTSPANGDVWTTTGGIFARVNGTTYQLASLSGSNTFTSEVIAPAISSYRTDGWGVVAVGTNWDNCWYIQRHPDTKSLTFNNREAGVYKTTVKIDPDGTFTARDLIASRGNGTGAIFFGAASDARWIHYDGTVYGFNVAPVRVPMLEVRGEDPTIKLRDITGGQWSSFIHNNSNYFYVLRGGTDANTWDSGPNGRHPMQLSLTDGTVTFSGNVGAYSDLRMKKNVRPITDALAKVLAMQGVWFDRIESGETSAGVIAQQLRPIAPELVREDRDGMLSVDYGNLAGYFIEAIKELAAKLEAR